MFVNQTRKNGGIDLNEIDTWINIINKIFFSRKVYDFYRLEGEAAEQR